MSSRERRGATCGNMPLSPLYIKLRTSPLDTGPEQGYTCSMKLLNWPRKVSLLHPARPIEKARTSSAWFLSTTDHERVAGRLPQYRDLPMVGTASRKRKLAQKSQGSEARSRQRRHPWVIAPGEFLQTPSAHLWSQSSGIRISPLLPLERPYTRIPGHDLCESATHSSG